MKTQVFNTRGATLSRSRKNNSKQSKPIPLKNSQSTMLSLFMKTLTYTGLVSAFFLSSTPKMTHAGFFQGQHPDFYPYPCEPGYQLARDEWHYKVTLNLGSEHNTYKNLFGDRVKIQPGPCNPSSHVYSRLTQGPEFLNKAIQNCRNDLQHDIASRHKSGTYGDCLNPQLISCTSGPVNLWVAYVLHLFVCSPEHHDEI